MGSAGSGRLGGHETCFRSFGDGTTIYNINTSPSRAGVILSELDKIGCGREWGLVTCLTVEAAKPSPTRPLGPRVRKQSPPPPV